MKNACKCVVLLMCGCANSPTGQGFQPEYPYEFRPWNNSPYQFNFDVNTFIDTTPYVLFPREDFQIYYP